MRDFTLDAYAQLLKTLGASKSICCPLQDFDAAPRSVGLRHDVDRLPGRAVAMARIENAAGVAATYFFRTRPHVLRPQAIAEIAALGHEIGYHYEDLPDARGDLDTAWDAFRRNLERLRHHAPVTSIAMHGRPLSPHDSRTLWSRFDYRSVGIAREAYLDVDWSRTHYFTDTGRGWNSSANVRDRPLSEALATPPQASTDALSRFVANSASACIISSHPERWTNSQLGWLQVRLTDGAINLIKRGLGRGGKSAPEGRP